MNRLALIFGASLMCACSEPTLTPVNLPGKPAQLSDWGAVASNGKTLRLGEGVTPYTLNNPLFTDYAHKLRTVWIPEGAATYQAGEVFDFPVGTVITKTFYYPTDGAQMVKSTDLSPVNATTPLDLSTHRLIETRILTRREEGWQPISYVWNADQTEAELKRTGAVIPLTLNGNSIKGGNSIEGDNFAYIVPNENQCASCHADNATTKTIRPLGPRAEQLTGPYRYDDQRGHEVKAISGTHNANADLGTRAQLIEWEQRGLLTGVPASLTGWADWSDDAQPLADRARAYLAANCAHCHNPVGPADTSGLDLTVDHSSAVALGRCKLPIAAGSGTGGHRFDITPGQPDASILTYRMESTDPGAMMPELGRALVHTEGVALVSDWIAEMEGDCAS